MNVYIMLLDEFLLLKVIQGDCHLYPDMAAYHSIAVTLGQAGHVKELISIIECMRQKPSKKMKNARRNWDPILEPDVVIYNAVRGHNYLDGSKFLTYINSNITQYFLI